MKFELDPLPFARTALEPYISERTLGFHYDKHHQGYMAKLDAGLEDKSQRDWSLTRIIREGPDAVFNAAAQVWNHTFYWNSLDPTGRSEPDGDLTGLINACFGDLNALKAELKKAGTGEFGSGWIWLNFNPASGRLEVSSTTDAETPVTGNLVPLLTIDVWEHAYYLDYQNDRGGYLDACLDNLINWDFANRNLASS